MPLIPMAGEEWRRIQVILHAIRRVRCARADVCRSDPRGRTLARLALTEFERRQLIANRNEL
jgi:hypothetical protein